MNKRFARCHLILQQLVRNHAAKEIQREQERKAKLRREIIEKRCGQPKPQKGLGDTELRALCQEYQVTMSFVCAKSQ